MASEDEHLKELEAFANAEYQLFENIGRDVLDFYEKGEFNFFLAGPIVDVGARKKIYDILLKKHNIAEEKLDVIGSALTLCIHTILARETAIILEKLVDPELKKKMEKKLNFTEDLLKEHPKIRQGYLTYTFSKTDLFSEVEWETYLKVFQSASRWWGEEPYPQFSVAKIKISTQEPPKPPIERKIKSFEFEISEKDLDNFISSLQDLQKALRNISGKKLANKGEV